MKYLVTGGAGFIGSNIVKKVLEQGDSVRVVDNFSTGKKENIKEFLNNTSFELIEGDLTNIEVARKSVEGVDFVLHEAAMPSVQRSIEDPIKSNNANITATLNLLVSARDEGIERFIYASSSSIYGDNPELPKKEDMPVMPISPYALTKYVGERYCQIFWRLYDLPTICLRYFNVFGPGQDSFSQYAAVIPNFISSVLKGKRPIIFGDGNQSRDFTFIDDVVEANLLAVKAKEGFGEVFNIACDKTNSLNQLLLIIEEVVGAKAVVEYKDRREGDVLHSRADISKAKKILGYMPKVEFKDGLIKTVDWFKENGK